MRHRLAAVILLSFMICLRTPLCASAAETAPEAVPGEALQPEEPAGENTEEVTDNSKDGPERSEETSEDGNDSEAVETGGGEEYDTKEDHGAQEDRDDQQPFLDVTGGQADSPEAVGTVETVQKTASDAAQQSVKKSPGGRHPAAKSITIIRTAQKRSASQKSAESGVVINGKMCAFGRGVVRSGVDRKNIINIVRFGK